MLVVLVLTVAMTVVIAPRVVRLALVVRVLVVLVPVVSGCGCEPVLDIFCPGQ